jgi:hypothetical protein
MKHVHIHAQQAGLVFRKGNYQRMLAEGSYWLWNKDVYVYSRMRRFESPVELNILLADPVLADNLIAIEVTDTEIALQYENGLLKHVLTPGRYAFWKSAIQYHFVKADISKVEISPSIDRTILVSSQLAPFVRNATVAQHEQAVLYIDGKYSGLLESGTYFWWKNSIPVHVAKADRRQQQVEINGQEILTRDKAALRINAFGQYRVADMEKALLQNKEYEKQLYVAFQLALREYVGKLSFDELLEHKDAAGAAVLQHVQQEAIALGVEVSGFGIRDIVLPGDIKEIMNQVLVAEKKAQAKASCAGKKPPVPGVCSTPPGSWKKIPCCGN